MRKQLCVTKFADYIEFFVSFDGAEVYIRINPSGEVVDSSFKPDSQSERNLRDYVKTLPLYGQFVAA